MPYEFNTYQQPTSLQYYTGSNAGNVTGSVSFTQGFKPSVKTVTGSYVVQATDYTVLTSSSINFNVQLPSLSTVTAGQEFRFKVNGSNLTTLVPSGSDLIDGNALYYLSKTIILGLITSPQISLTLVASGSNWNIIV